jgi:opacity protein-like surface antigen
VVRFKRWLLPLVLASIVLAVSPEAGRAEGPEIERRAQGSEIERWLDGSQPFSLGVDTQRFRVSSGARPVIGTEDPLLSGGQYRLLDSDVLGTALSFDLTLRWPRSSGSSGLGPLDPYLSFGPTLLMPGVEGVSRPGPAGARGDGPMALGLSWGAGLSWRLSRNTELYGGYRFLQFGRENLSHDRAENELTGHDVLYGISVRF